MVHHDTIALLVIHNTPAKSNPLIKIVYALFTSQFDTRAPSNSKRGASSDLIVAIIVMNAIIWLHVFLLYVALMQMLTEWASTISHGLNICCFWFFKVVTCKMIMDNLSVYCWAYSVFTYSGLHCLLVGLSSSLPYLHIFWKIVWSGTTANHRTLTCSQTHAILFINFAFEMIVSLGHVTLNFIVKSSFLILHDVYKT